MERCGISLFISYFVLTSITGFTDVFASECRESDIAWNRLEQKYVVNKTAVTWFGAYVACLQCGMDLAVIKSKEEEQALEAELTKYCHTDFGVYHGYWIGGTRNGSPNDAYLWFATGEQMAYNKFSKGQPDRAGGVEACVHVFIADDHQYFWNDLPCTNKLGFICQTRRYPTNCCAP